MTLLAPHPHIQRMLDDLLARMQAILASRLVGLYLYGSLVTGDFDNEVSDVDLLAATSEDMNAAEFAALKAMQDEIIAAHLGGDDRIEIAYLSLHALRTFKTQASNIAIVSPGEP